MAEVTERDRKLIDAFMDADAQEEDLSVLEQIVAAYREAAVAEERAKWREALFPGNQDTTLGEFCLDPKRAAGVIAEGQKLAVAEERAAKDQLMDELHEAVLAFDKRVEELINIEQEERAARQRAEQERDSLRQLINDEWNDGCREECDSYGHSEDCPAVSLSAALKDRRKRAEAAEAARVKAEQERDKTVAKFVELPLRVFRLENSLRESEARLRAVIEAADDLLPILCRLELAQNDDAALAHYRKVRDDGR